MTIFHQRDSHGPLFLTSDPNDFQRGGRSVAAHREPHWLIKPMYLGNNLCSYSARLQVARESPPIFQKRLASTLLPLISHAAEGEIIHAGPLWVRMYHAVVILLSSLGFMQTNLFTNSIAWDGPTGVNSALVFYSSSFGAINTFKPSWSLPLSKPERAWAHVALLYHQQARWV
jgi:hypothetical protein